MSVHDQLNSLRKNEKDVLYLVYQGLQYGEIAQRFRKSEQWVQLQMSTVYSKFGIAAELHWSQKREILERDFFPNFPKERKDWDDPRDPIAPEPPDEPRRRPSFLLPIIGVVVLCACLLIVGYIVFPILRSMLNAQPTSTIAPGPAVAPSEPVVASQPTSTALSPIISPTPLLTDTPSIPTEASVPTQAAFVPPADGVLFQDTFDDGIDPAWQQINGRWITNNGRLSIIFEDFRYVWLVLNRPEWRNYHIQAELDRTYGQIAVGVRDRSLYLISGFYGINCWTTDIQGNADCILGEADRGLNPAKTTLEIDVNGDEYVARLDGSVSQRLTMSGSSSGGVSIGIYCQRGFECPSVDNFKVTYLP